MRKIAVSTVLMMLLLIPVALAIEPCPFGFTFMTSPPGSEVGLHVQLSYMDGRTWTDTVKDNGEVVMDLGTAGIPNCLQQNFRFTILECRDNPVCTRTVSFNPNGYIVIDLSSVNLFKAPIAECPADMTPYGSCSSCCAEVPCEEKGYILPEKCPVKECPDITLDIIIGIIVSLAVGAGVGFKVTKYGTKVHYHPGRIDYHSPDLTHSAPYTHRKGEMFPKYQKDESGKWKYVGG